MELFEQNVTKYCLEHHMFTRGDRIVLGVSGGADSVALLLFFHAIKQEEQLSLEVLHVHHGIREEAQRDAAFVQSLCERLGESFQIIKAEVPSLAKKWHMSEEEAGRKVRYDAFYSEAGGVGKIAVAHHIEDQAETVLHNLFRGSALTGLRGMLPVNGQIIRPFLACTRAEIEAYIGAKGESFVTDATNLQDHYTRNKIRHQILKYAEDEINGKSAVHVAKAAQHLRLTEEYINRQTNLALKECVEADTGKIVISKFVTYDPFLQRQMLHTLLQKSMPGLKDLQNVHVEQMMELLLKEGEKELSLPHGIRVRKTYDRLEIFTGETKKKEEMPVYTLSPPDVIVFPDGSVLETEVFSYVPKCEIPKNTYTKWFDYDKIKQPIQLRTRRSGDYLCMDDKLSKKTIKQYFIDEKIPKSNRDEMWLLAEGAHILWVPGYRISERAKIDAGTKRILAVNLRGGNQNG